jgi:hypothetical protein
MNNIGGISHDSVIGGGELIRGVVCAMERILGKGEDMDQKKEILRRP